MDGLQSLRKNTKTESVVLPQIRNRSTFLCRVHRPLKTGRCRSMLWSDSGVECGGGKHASLIQQVALHLKLPLVHAVSKPGWRQNYFLKTV
jgi:hypothetical protein